MGRQFSFFLGPDDILGFEETLSSKNDISFLADRPLSPAAVSLPRLTTVTMRTLLARPEDLPKILFTPVRNQKFFSSDCFSQNFIECDILCESRDGYLQEGRLYYHAIYWDAQNRHVQKPNEFVKWTESLFRRTKRSLKLVEKPFYYAGEHALRLRAAGIKFNQLDR